MDEKQTSYDEVPYEGHPFPQSHPDRLATIGKLFGLKSEPITKSRVLELGCGCGGNIIPMASNLPDSEFVGVDLSNRQVEMGRQVIEAVELDNIRIEHANIMDIDESWGKFDYIIAHGVYSWVPDEVQNKILSISSKNLSKNGIAYVSYNTYPGWHIREMIRHMMLFHSGQFSDIKQKVQQARALIDFLANSVPTENNYYGMLLKRELETIKKSKDYYLFHEHLEETNSPVYFYQFIQKAHGHDLQYLGESIFGSMLAAGFPKKIEETLKRISSNIISTEQYMDFLRNRVFRSTLLCHKDQKIKRNLNSSDFKDILVCLSRIPQSRPDDFSPEKDFLVSSQKGREMKVRHPMAKATIAALCDEWPGFIRADVLFDRATKILKDIGGETAKTSQQGRESFMRELFRFYSSNIFEFHVWQAPMVNRISDRPRVSRLAATQAARNPRVVNQRHGNINLDFFDQQIVRVMNDAEDREALHGLLLELTKNGTITLKRNDEVITDTELLNKVVKEAVARGLSRLAAAALLVE